MATCISVDAQEPNERRIALLIGNSAYQNVPVLKNPQNDAADLADALEATGFEVLKFNDQSQSSMLDTLRTFRRQAVGADIAVIYYAGHGIEIDRQNYLIPVDAVLETDADVNFEAVRLETLMFAASGAKRLSMVIVDACRDNPFAATMERVSSSRSIGRGLSAVEPTKNTLVAYAAKEGTTAADGAGRNSPYASALIAALKQPNLEIGLMLRQVRDDVLEVTNGQQEPFVYGSLSADKIYLNDTRGLRLVAPEAPAITPLAPLQKGTDTGEIAFWQSVANSNSTAELELYLSRYPDGNFAGLARTRIASLENAAPELIPLVDVEPNVQAREVEPDRSLNRTEIRELQERLSTIGFRLGSADGIAGNRTRTAIRNFEKDADLPVVGEPTLSVLSALRERVADSELKTWRANQRTAAAPVRTTTRTAPSTAPKPQATPAPSTTPEQSEAAAPSNAFSQFCQAHSQCGTRECRGGGSTPVWRKTGACRLCTIYAQRCE